MITVDISGLVSVVEHGEHGTKQQYWEYPSPLHTMQP